MNNYQQGIIVGIAVATCAYSWLVASRMYRQKVLHVMWLVNGLCLIVMTLGVIQYGVAWYQQSHQEPLQSPSHSPAVFDGKLIGILVDLDSPFYKDWTAEMKKKFPDATMTEVEFVINGSPLDMSVADLKKKLAN